MINQTFTDDHLSALDIKDDTILILRSPFQSSAVDLVNAMRTIKMVIQNKTGHDPGLLLVPRDCDLALMDIDSLIMLRNEIDASLQYIYSKSGAEVGN